MGSITSPHLAKVGSTKDFSLVEGQALAVSMPCYAPLKYMISIPLGSAMSGECMKKI